jgi:hypothetical protein
LASNSPSASNFSHKYAKATNGSWWPFGDLEVGAVKVESNDSPTSLVVFVIRGRAKLSQTIINFRW